MAREIRGTPDVGLTYPILQREMKKRAVRSMFVEGRGGPLVFLWAIGAAAFVALLGQPVLILPLTAGAVVIGWLMTAD